MNRSVPSDASRHSATIPGLAARSRAAELIHAVVEERRPLDDSFYAGEQVNDEHSASDRALTHALVMTTLRRLPTLDAAINACLARRLPASARRATAILRIMASQLLIMDVPAHAAVTLAVEDMARGQETRKFKGLTNAIGRRMTREKDALLDLAPATDVPGWLQERWTETYGRKRTAKIAAALHDQPAIDLSLKPDVPVEDALGQLAYYDARQVHRLSLRLRKPGAIAQLPGFAEGHWWVQDIAASLPAKILLDALDGPAEARVLDLCAAPGGKTAQLAAAGANVTAVDQSDGRMERLKDNMKRLRLSATTHVADALTYEPDELFDAVLLDAPCSATGTLRRNPDIAYVRRPEDIKTVAALQASILQAASKMVKPGGILVYATCSMEPEEGSEQVSAFLSRFSQWSLDEIDPLTVPRSTRMPDGTLRTLPNMFPLPDDQSVAGGMDGFFAARLRRRA